MSHNRTARNEAWIASLVVHVALLAGLIAAVGLPRESPGGPVVINTRDSGHEVGVVLLTEAPPARPVAAPPAPVAIPPAPPVTVKPISPAGPPSVSPEVPPPPPVRVAEHREPAVGNATPVVTPAAYAAGSPAAVSNSTPAAAAPPSEPPLPAGAVTAFFGVPAVGKSVVFVLDRSASMGLDGRLDRARRELAASLRRLPPSARFQIIAYNRTAEVVSGPPGLLPVTSVTVETTITAVARLPAEGSSEHVQALAKALSLQPDVIYFLTDEDDLDWRDAQTVTRVNHGRVCIHALCLVPPAGETPMQVLARQNRGQFQVVR